MNINDYVKGLRSPIAKRSAKIGIYYFACGVMLILEFAVAVKKGWLGFMKGFSFAYTGAYSVDILNGKMRESVLKKSLRED